MRQSVCEDKVKHRKMNPAIIYFLNTHKVAVLDLSPYSSVIAENI